MWGRRADRRRTDGRAFQPTLDGNLEPRLLLSKVHALSLKDPIGIPGNIRTAFGGQAVEITNASGKSFYILVTSGTVQAYRMSGGRFGLTIKGSSVDSEVTINPVIDEKVKGTAHTFNNRLSHYNQLINIGAINVTSGTVSAILGYRSAILSGPLVVNSTNRVDRIAFDTVAPGASIIVGGDLNTLDVLNNLTVSGPATGVVIGRDLNSLSVGGNLNIANAAVFSIARYQGLIPQPAKGTAPQPQPIENLNTSTVVTVPIATAAIGGNLVLTNGGRFIVGQALQGFFLVNGATIGAANIQINGNGNLFISRGGIS